MKLYPSTTTAAQASISLVFGVVLAVWIFFPANGNAEEMTISGFTESRLDSKLGLPVTGVVHKIYQQEGHMVEKGQVILELDQRTEKLEMGRRELIWKNRTEVDAATKLLQTLSSQLQDSRNLYESTGSIPREEMENQQLEYDLAEIDLKRLEIVEEREKREYEIAREELQKRTLRAPFSGHVVALMIGPGENCEPDTQLVHLVSTEHVDFVANVELGISQKLEIGQSVNLQLQVGSQSIGRDAEIVFISPVVDPASGLRTVKARFDNTDGEVVPGITGSMRFNAQ